MNGLSEYDEMNGFFFKPFILQHIYEVSKEDL